VRFPPPTHPGVASRAVHDAGRPDLGVLRVHRPIACMAAGVSFTLDGGWARGNPGRTQREDPPPLLADLDCAVRGSDPLLRVCLEPSRHDQATPATGARATDQCPRTQDLRPGSAGSTADVARPLRHVLWPAPSAILIFAVNGFRCPPAEIAEHLGAGRGPVTDIYLPGLDRPQPARYPCAATPGCCVPCRQEHPPDSHVRKRRARLMPQSDTPARLG